MAHAKGLSGKAVENILLNTDSQEDFGSESSESESQYESRSDTKPMGCGDATTARKF
jgi:hypothetical protein